MEGILHLFDKPQFIGKFQFTKIVLTSLQIHKIFWMKTNE
jgi:hypothetical protein